MNRDYGFAMLCMRPSVPALAANAVVCSLGVKAGPAGIELAGMACHWHFAIGIPVQHFCITAFTSQPFAACGLLYAVLES